MDDERGGGLGEGHGFREGGAGGECEGERGGNGVTRADDIDRAAERESGHVFDGRAGCGADDAVLGEGDEDGARGAGGEALGAGAERGEGLVSGRRTARRSARSTALEPGFIERGEFGGVHFPGAGRETREAMAAVGEDEEARKCAAYFGNAGEHVVGHRTATGVAGLIHHDEGVEVGRERAERGDELGFNVGGQRRGVLEVEPRELLGRLAGAVEERFRVGKRVARGGGDEVVERDAGHAREGAAEFEALAIVAAVAERVQRAGPEGGGVGEDVARGAGLAAHARDVVHGEAGFDGALGAGGIDIEVAVEREIAEHADAQGGEAAGEVVETRRGHAATEEERARRGNRALQTRRRWPEWRAMAASSSEVGFKAETMRGTAGFFRVAQHRSGAWWLLDPAGEPWFGRAVNGVGEAAGEEHPVARLRRWGFNALGAGAAAAWRGDGLPFLASAEFCAAGALIRGEHVCLPDVFDPAWARQARAHAAAMCAGAAERNDVIGWLTDTELAWGETPASGRPTLLQTCLSLEPRFAAYHAAWEFVLAPHGGRLESLGRAWQVPLTNREVVRELTRNEQGIASRGYARDDARWAREFARRYFMLTAAALRESAPGHLIFGGRAPRGTDATVRREAVYPAVDVACWQAEEIGAATTGPVWADGFTWARESFWSAAGRPRRLTAVERMLRRGRAALEQLARHPAVVGYAWSRWSDEPAEQPPFAQGLVHANGAEAREHTELLADVNARAENLRRAAAGRTVALSP